MTRRQLAAAAAVVPVEARIDGDVVEGPRDGAGERSGVVPVELDASARAAEGEVGALGVVAERVVVGRLAVGRGRGHGERAAALCAGADGLGVRREVDERRALDQLVGYVGRHSRDVTHNARALCIGVAAVSGRGWAAVVASGLGTRGYL